ncbi:MAG: hypothetical protein HY315_02880 [Acidobacteria bacterium]|nr:hypothetical protein [Acidobacteriota bacterium]
MRRFAALLAAVLLVSASAPAADFYPIENIVPGQKGIGRTVFNGDTIEEFQVEILGVLHNSGPHQNQILARLSGGAIETVGVFQGMSGSPVYIDGKIAGAVAYAMAFSKEAIAGITPIQEIVDIFEEKDAVLRDSDTPKPIRLLSLLSPSPTTVSAFRNAGAGFAVSGLSSSLIPIGTPLSFSGFHPAAIAQFAPQLQAMGFAPVMGGVSGSLPKAAGMGAVLKPGSTLSVQLIRGDMDINASGTVTYVDGDRIYAFGHPFLGIGYTELPLNHAEVVALLPNLQASSKVSQTMEPVGAVVQDRATGILGIAGRKPRMIPVTIRLTTSRNEKTTFNYEVVTDPFLTPFLMNFTVFNTLVSSERGIGHQTLQLKTRIAVRDHPEVSMENSVSAAANTPVFASLTVSAPVEFLLNSGFREMELEKVDVDIVALEETRQAVLEGLWENKSRVRAGDDLELTLFMKKSSGEVVSQKYPINIPDDVVPGPMFVMVSDGSTLAQRDADETPGLFVPKSIGQLIRAINNIKKNDRLYIRVYRDEPGAMIRGEILSGLPPSVLSILKSSKTSGGINPLRKSVYREYELPQSDFVMTGQRIVRIEVID